MTRALTIILLFAAMNATAQDTTRPSVFKRGYIRLGLSTLGKDLSPTQTPLQNALAGNYGAGQGYCFEFGHIFYFRKRAEGQHFNYGLDWTILSLNYNPLDKWEAYGRGNNPVVDGAKVSIAAASRIGPVLAYRPTGKLVIESRFQMVYMARVTDLDYSDQHTSGNRNFTYLSDQVKPAIATSFGVAVRYQFIGLSLDYINAKIPTAYEIKQNGSATIIEGNSKFPAKDLQLKLSFTF